MPQIGQGSTHVAHHVMLKQQSFKRGGRGRSQIVETRQGSKIDRREGGGGERRAGLGKGVRGKEGSFQNSVDVFIMSLLPGISQTRTFLNVYGAELRLLLKGNNTIIIITCGNSARWL